MLKNGDVSPLWSALDHEGLLHSSETLKGLWFLLYFYPKDDTPGCTIEACGFRDAWADLNDRVTILGVSADTKESHEAFIAKYSLPFPLLVDEDKKMISAFGAHGSVFPKRTSFLVDQNGIIRQIYKDFDCTTHASDVLSDVIRYQDSR